MFGVERRVVKIKGLAVRSHVHQFRLGPKMFFEIRAPRVRQFQRRIQPIQHEDKIDVEGTSLLIEITDAVDFVFHVDVGDVCARVQFLVGPIF